MIHHLHKRIQSFLTSGNWAQIKNFRDLNLEFELSSRVCSIATLGVTQGVSQPSPLKESHTKIMKGEGH
jgi:hypothetical protein